MIKNILILGSKPKPTLPKKVNCIYFVNGSIYAYKNFKEATKNHIITSDCFEEKEWLNYYKKLLQNKNINNLIILTKKNTNVKEIEKKLKLSNYKYKMLIILSQKYKKKLIINTLSRITLFRITINRPDDIKRKIKEIIKLLINKREDAKYRPSTGVLACLYAINKYRENNKIIISGMGIKKGSHAYNKYQIYYDNHCYFDKQIFKILSKKRYIFTTDDKLSSYSGIEKLENN